MHSTNTSLSQVTGTPVPAVHGMEVQEAHMKVIMPDIDKINRKYADFSHLESVRGGLTGSDLDDTLFESAKVKLPYPII